jgi:2-phosphosulfolactate phosphatase
MDVYGQEPFPCRFQWGPDCARLAAAAGHIVVIVDVLVFSTSITTVVDRGASVLPVGSIAEARAEAERWSAVELPGRARPTAEGWSHSPVTLTTLPDGLRLVYTSANGARCCAATEGATAVLVGGLMNASAVGRAAAGLHAQTGRPITVIGCGERWDDGSLRPALEDELGAGAIIAALPLAKSVEARGAEALFLARRDVLVEDLWDCASGRELRAREYGDDVTFAARLDICETVPMRDQAGWLRQAE